MINCLRLERVLSCHESGINAHSDTTAYIHRFKQKNNSYIQTFALSYAALYGRIDVGGRIISSLNVL